MISVNHKNKKQTQSCLSHTIWVINNSTYIVKGRVKIKLKTNSRITENNRSLTIMITHRLILIGEVN